VRKNFHLAERATSVVSHPERETFSYVVVVEDEVFGRKDDKERVMEWVIEADNDRDVSVLLIVNFGFICVSQTHVTRGSISR